MMKVTDEMVDRFLAWRLPEDFHPDAGISFSPYFNVEYNAKQGKPPQRHQPIGTNLLTATQARQMLEHVLVTAPSENRGLVGWTSVKDRLPELSGYYQIWTTRMPPRLTLDIVPSAYFYSTGEGGWSRHRSYGGQGTVTHWMPLPEEPK